MDYKIQENEQKGQKFVDVRVFGSITRDMMAACVMEAVQYGRKKQIVKALWDMTETILEDTFVESHLFMEGLTQLGVDYTDKVALVYHNNAHQHEHAENVAFNRGFSNFRYFMDRKEALNWLTEA